MTDDQNRQLAELFQAFLRRIDNWSDPEDEMRELQRVALTALPLEQRKAFEQNLADKQVVRRFNELSETLGEIVQGEKRLVAGATIGERAAQYEEVISHVRELWRDATTAFDSERYSTASFLAIACMEEVGKGGVARWQLFWDAHPERIDRTPRCGRGVLYSHPKKHLLVAGKRRPHQCSHRPSLRRGPRPTVPSTTSNPARSSDSDRRLSTSTTTEPIFCFPGDASPAMTHFSTPSWRAS